MDIDGVYLKVPWGVFDLFYRYGVIQMVVMSHHMQLKQERRRLLAKIN